MSQFKFSMNGGYAVKYCSYNVMEIFQERMAI